MHPSLNRREFVGAAAAGLTLAVAGRAQAKDFKHPFHKAVMAGKTDEKTLQEIKDAGFEGIEALQWQVTPEEAKAARKRAEKVGLVIHSVLLGWLDFNSENPRAFEVGDRPAGRAGLWRDRRPVGPLQARIQHLHAQCLGL